MLAKRPRAPHHQASSEKKRKEQSMLAKRPQALHHQASSEKKRKGKNSSFGRGVTGGKAVQNRRRRVHARFLSITAYYGTQDHWVGSKTTVLAACASTWLKLMVKTADALELFSRMLAPAAWGPA
eukprot:1141514-Pelagomonas_calceolata.AAC.1